MGQFTATHLVVLLVTAVVFAGVLLLVLWPTVRSGARMLRNWGVAEPTSEQAQVARKYLLQRRLLYVLFIILAGPASGLAVLAIGRADFPYVGWFLVALLLAELIAMLRPVRGEVRVATLERRGIVDVLPIWMIVVHLVTVAAAVASHQCGCRCWWCCSVRPRSTPWRGSRWPGPPSVTPRSTGRCDCAAPGW